MLHVDGGLDKGEGEREPHREEAGALRNLNWRPCQGVGAALFAALAVGEEVA